MPAHVLPKEDKVKNKECHESNAWKLPTYFHLYRFCLVTQVKSLSLLYFNARKIYKVCRENTNLLLAFSIFRAKNSSIYLLFCLLVLTNFSYSGKKIWLDTKEFINIAKMLMASPTQWT